MIIRDTSWRAQTPARRRIVGGWIGPVLALVVLMAGMAGAQEPESPMETSPAGAWEGAIQLPNGELGIAVELQQGDEGAWSGTIDIPAQGLKDFPLDNVAVEPPKVHFEMAGIPGQPTFDGQLSKNGDGIAGSFQQGPQNLSFSLRRVEGNGEEASEEAAARPPEIPAEPVPGEGMAGEWMGVLNPGPVKLRLVLRVEEKDGKLSATFESVDQGATLDVDTIELAEQQLTFSIQRAGASYEGTLNEDGSAVDGTWKQGGATFPLVFHRLAESFALNRPQTPQPPFPYDATEVTFTNPDSEITLAGTLLTPHGDGPFPAVVMVTGSGPQDRDESLMGHKPFWIIADHLARHGIASLRYDDRGVGGSGGNIPSSTGKDLTRDAQAGVAFLAQQAKIDRAAVGLVGHSEGGLIGPRAAVGSEDIDFLVLLAPPGEPLADLLERQARDIYSQQGVDEKLIDRALAREEEQLQILLDDSLSSEEVEKRLVEQTKEFQKEFTEEELQQLQFDPAAVEQRIRQVASPWFRSLIGADPAVYLKQVEVPVLALFGAKDLQVSSEVNAPILEASLKAAGNEDFEVVTFPDLNHLFQHAETGAIDEYGQIEETFAPEALEKISQWILERFGERGYDE
ncbi:MAG: alpha/beta hydrolase [Acidobacteriota bacterium]|nr:alpha/beta hydrolase [Acidobacteriota bacterium]